MSNLHNKALNVHIQRNMNVSKEMQSASTHVRWSAIHMINHNKIMVSYLVSTLMP